MRITMFVKLTFTKIGGYGGDLTLYIPYTCPYKYFIPNLL
jgi:hypothetical protein